MKALTLITSCAACLLLSTAVQGNEPRPYAAVYKAKALGISARATRRQSVSAEQQYVLENSLTLNLFGINAGTVTETSEFLWRDDELIPLHYRFVQTGLSATKQEIFFDWNNELAISQSDSNSWEIPITPGVVDKLSYSIQIGQDITQNGVSEFEYQVLDKGRIDEHKYRISSEEVLETPIGALNTVKIERVREPDSRRSTTVWLAKDWDYMLVRLEQVSSSGTETELSLESATMDGSPITGL